jgi:glycosyltransferase involved in cell wall biosynthesis
VGVRLRLDEDDHATAPAGPSALGVLFVHTATVPPLGADVAVHAQIMAHLDQRTHRLHAACTFAADGAPTPTFRVFSELRGVELHNLNLGRERWVHTGVGKVRELLSAFSALADVAGLVRTIRRERISIIHTSDRPRDAVASVLLARLTGAICVLHCHVGYGDWMSRHLKWALRHADARIAISRFVADTLAASGHDPDHTYVALNGIDPGRWTPRAGRAEARHALGLPADAPVVLTACRLFPSKGPAELIAAVATVRQRLADIRLIIAGHEMVPGFVAELEDLVRRLDLSANVQLLGHRRDVGALMAAADVFAMPSVGEPFGLVFTEAMAMELPVIALDSGAAPEVVEPRVTGLLVSPGDTAQLARDLTLLLSEPDRRARMGRAGRRRVETAFTSDRMADDVAGIYQAVLHGITAKAYEEDARERAVG